MNLPLEEPHNDERLKAMMENEMQCYAPVISDFNPRKIKAEDGSRKKPELVIQLTNRFIVSAILAAVSGRI